MNATYTKGNKTVTLSETLARKVIDTVSLGLCSGLGTPIPGRMCVEAAVNYACGFSHGDDPVCVGLAVRAFKISLNDSKYWKSNQSRAEGMKYIAVAQLGSDQLNQVEFSKCLTLKIINVLLADMLDECGLEAAAQRCREAKDLQSAYEAAENAANAAKYAAEYAAENAAEYAAYAADAAADAARYAANAAEYAEYASNAAKYAANAARYAAEYAEKYLTLAADLCLEVLIEMESPGVAFLHLVD